MSLNETPRSNRIHIALFGRTNAGKSSVINAITQQNISVVSDIKGTTTDPVYKAMELLPIGPVVMIDTAGLDDVTDLGLLRKEKTIDILNKTDMALLIIDATIGIQDFEKEILQQIRSKNIPIVGVLNKTDLIEGLDITHFEKEIDLKLIPISAENKTEIDTLKHAIIKALPDDSTDTLLGDLIEPNDIAVLVVPIDSAAPKGRLILPQQQVVREILDLNGICVVTKEFQLEESLKSLSKKPKVVITDSQAFEMVSKITPEDILLTSFSILFAKYKGDLKELVKGAEYIEKLKDGDHILISEGCTHHRQSDDIGTVKIPKWLKEHTGKDLNFHFSSGYGYPTDLQQFSLIIHCGACMLNKREVLHRIEQAKTNDIPIVNYGVLIAYLKGIFERALIPFDYEFAL